MFFLTVQANGREMEEGFAMGDPPMNRGTLKLLGITNIILQLPGYSTGDIRSILPALGVAPTALPDVHYIVPKEMSLPAEPIPIPYTEVEEQAFVDKEEQALNSIASSLLKSLQGLTLEEEIKLLRSAVEAWLMPEQASKGERRRTPLERFSVWENGASMLEQETLLNYPVYQPEDLTNFIRQQKGEPALRYTAPANNPQLHKGFPLRKVLDVRRNQVIIKFGSTTSNLKVKSYHRKLIDDEETGAEKIVIKVRFQDQPVFSECFSTQDGLLPLAWAEMLYCLRKGIHAGFCKVCGKVFVLPRLNPGTPQVYCSTGCRRKAENEERSNLPHSKEINALYKKLASTKDRETREILKKKIKKLKVSQ
jgi:hypothetical protein